jgi:hypothetical protein
MYCVNTLTAANSHFCVFCFVTPVRQHTPGVCGILQDSRAGKHMRCVLSFATPVRKTHMRVLLKNDVNSSYHTITYYRFELCRRSYVEKDKKWECVAALAKRCPTHAWRVWPHGRIGARHTPSVGRRTGVAVQKKMKRQCGKTRPAC